MPAPSQRASAGLGGGAGGAALPASEAMRRPRTVKNPGTRDVILFSSGSYRRTLGTHKDMHMYIDTWA